MIRSRSMSIHRLNVPPAFQQKRVRSTNEASRPTQRQKNLFHLLSTKPQSPLSHLELNRLFLPPIATHPLPLQYLSLYLNPPPGPIKPNYPFLILRSSSPPRLPLFSKKNWNHLQSRPGLMRRGRLEDIWLLAGRNSNRLNWRMRREKKCLSGRVKRLAGIEREV